VSFLSLRRCLSLASTTHQLVPPLLRRSFLALHTVIHPRAVTEFVYRYSSSSRAFIFLSFYLSSSHLPLSTTTTTTTGSSTPLPTPQQARQEELGAILTSLRAGGMNPLDISDNEMAKSHARYLVGGRSSVENERVFRFEFPERPGALRKFLEAMRFNISLFHYRNQGGGACGSSFSSPSLPYPSPLLVRTKLTPRSRRRRQDSVRSAGPARGDGRVRGVVTVARVPVRRGDQQRGL
jgi:hypothetical protein